MQADVLSAAPKPAFLSTVWVRPCVCPPGGRPRIGGRHPFRTRLTHGYGAVASPGVGLHARCEVNIGVFEPWCLAQAAIDKSVARIDPPAAYARLGRSWAGTARSCRTRRTRRTTFRRRGPQRALSACFRRL